MDPHESPFVPGVGSRPPELAGREDIISAATVARRRQAARRRAKSQMPLGLRGVGKTVLLGSNEEIAEVEGYLAATIEENSTSGWGPAPSLRPRAIWKRTFRSFSSRSDGRPRSDRSRSSSVKLNTWMSPIRPRSS